MKNPWELKVDEDRSSDSLKTIIIFCEDGEIEPSYFRLFHSSKIKLSIIVNCGDKHKQVDYATNYCRDNDLLEVVNHAEKLKLDVGAQVWCVFDRDKEPNDGLDSSFNNSISVAKQIGFDVAWSNDDFELWILIHFEDVPVNDPAYYHRSKYYERLTQILKALIPNSSEQFKLVNNPRFDYYSSMKRRNRFLQITYQLMKGKIGDATARAVHLEQFHASQGYPYHQHCPCTLIHHLIKELTA